MNDSQQPELQTLLTALLDGTLSAEQQQRLSDCIRHDPQAKQAYLEHCELHAFLLWENGLLGSGLEALDTSTPVEKHAKPAKSTLPWLPAAVAALIAFCAAVLLIEYTQTGSHPSSGAVDDATDRAAVVAVLSAVNNAQWEREEWAAGQVFHEGQHFKLKGGLAELTFASGARLMLEGPSSLDITSAWDATLRQGQVHAAIPAQAHGFRLISSEVEVDRGSEFSLLADEQGASELFVHSGTVEGAIRENNGAKRTPLTLKARESRRFSKLGATEIQDRERKWLKLQRRMSQEVPRHDDAVIHWSFDSAEPQRWIASRNGTPLFDRSIRDNGNSATSIPDRKSGSALAISTGMSLVVPLPELSESSPRTIAFWLRVPGQKGDESVVAEWLVSGTNKSGHRLLRVLLNDGMERGSRGALRTELGRFSICSVMPLDDGKWHHVAWVFVAGEGAPPLQYIDGRLDGATARMAVKPRRLPRPDRSELREGQLLLGGVAMELDDFTHVNRALTPREISELAGASE